MKIPLLTGRSALLVPLFLMSFVFFLPLSNTLKSIGYCGCIVTIFFTPEYNQYLAYTFNTLWGRAALAFVGFILLACLWSSAPWTMRLMVTGKYLKIVALPIFAVGFIRPGLRFWAINAFLAAMVITCILSIIKAWGFIAGGDAGELFYNHIVTGFMMAFATYLSGTLMLRYKGKSRLIYGFIMLFTSYQVLFINTGRTGYIIYFILMILLLLEHLPVKKAFVGMLLFTGLMAVVYSQSAMMHERIKDLIQQIHAMRQHEDENTSVGYRMQFHQYAKSLFDKNPLFGIGTGGFKYSFAQDQPIPSWGDSLNDPHSQYWMILAEQGIAGILLLAVFLASLLWTSFKLQENRFVAWGILVAFGIGSFSDTILCYSAVGYLLVVMSALSFGELVEEYGEDTPFTQGDMPGTQSG